MAPGPGFTMIIVDRGCRRLLCSGDVGIEVLKSERKLVAVEPFRSPAELRALQALNHQPKTLDLSPHSRKLSSLIRGLRGKIAHQPMQRIDIGGERGEIEIHARESNAGAQRHPP
jgi:hypothetical protein